jgi:hypothetical protein
MIFEDRAPIHVPQLLKWNVYAQGRLIDDLGRELAKLSIPELPNKLRW